MANKDHIEVVRQGSAAINDFRALHPNVQLDLQGADFRRIDLIHANLSGANLKGSNLEWADFRWADLVKSDLSGSNLSRADLFKVDLKEANLKDAILTHTNLEDALLQDAILVNAVFSYTRMLNTDLSDAIGLDRIRHLTKSEIDNETIYKSGNLPDSFLLGCGRNLTYQATIYRVLIGSPSDVQEERRIARDTIYSWYDDNSKSTGVVLLPVLWETHSTPIINDQGPQSVLNSQVVEPSQILVAIFWHRLGTPTSKYKSGTVEEIEKFISQKKPTLVYFCTRPIPQDFDGEEFNRLKQFKNSLKFRGLFAEFLTREDLSQKLEKHLTETVRDLLSSPNPNINWREEVFNKSNE